VRDVLSVLARRFPVVDVEVLPVPVQGADAAVAIRSMLAKAGASGRYDALLLTRGGGSLEDLWSFNDEALARAIVASPVPVVSAIGHEIDFTLAEFAADLRAATPSAAAELLVPSRDELSTRIGQWQRRLAAAMSRRIANAAQRNDHAWLRLRAMAPGARLERGRQRLATLRQRLDQRMVRSLEQRALVLRGLGRALNSVSPLATLARGYAIVRDPSDGHVLRRSSEASTGQLLDIQLADGRLPVKVEPNQR
jgi:exodeoxyribonuclease VII large subunit